MQLRTYSFAGAAASTAGVAYLVCAAFTALWPAAALRLLGWVAHIVNVEKFAGDVSMSFGSVTAGLVEIVLYAYLFAWLLAWFYNRFAEQGS